MPPVRPAAVTHVREAAGGGAIWALWRKGQAALKDDHVRRAARAQGLVDVKVMAFSDELSALTLVIPRALRIAVPSRQARR